MSAPQRSWRAGPTVLAWFGFWLAGAGASGSACAQLSGSVAVDSDYRIRGVSFSNSKPTLRAALNYDAANGAYLGASVARVESIYRERYVQATPYAGYALPVAPQRSLEFGLTYSHFAGDSGDDYAEAYVGLLAERWSARVFYAPDYFGRQVRTLYAEFNVHTVMNPVARLFAHAGLLASVGGNAASRASRTRTDLRLGAGFALGDVDLQLAWSGATRGGPEQTVYRGRRCAFVASASLSF